MEVEKQEIISQFRAGDPKALEILFRSYYKPLCLFADRLLKDRLAAEDIVVEVFIKLWERHKLFKSQQNIKAFLYISTRNASLNLLKQAQRDSLTKRQAAYINGDEDGYILNEIVKVEVMKEMLVAVDGLPGQCQKICKLSFLKGLKNQEIASSLNISVHTVKNQKVRALQLLKDRLSRN